MVTLKTTDPRWPPRPPAAADPADAPKPDGWHTYHICGGLLRELTWSGTEALCVWCGEWFEARVTTRERAQSRRSVEGS